MEVLSTLLSNSLVLHATCRGQRWAQPSEEHLRELMRHVVTHQEEARARGAAARAMVLQEYSVEVGVVLCCMQKGRGRRWGGGAAVGTSMLWAKWVGAL